MTSIFVRLVAIALVRSCQRGGGCMYCVYVCVCVCVCLCIYVSISAFVFVSMFVSVSFCLCTQLVLQGKSFLAVIFWGLKRVAVVSYGGGHVLYSG